MGEIDPRVYAIVPHSDCIYFVLLGVGLTCLPYGLSLVNSGLALLHVLSAITS